MSLMWFVAGVACTIGLEVAVLAIMYRFGEKRK
jgi:hypothetical protein